MLFKEIPGNERLKKQLINSARNNRISHAQLFTGNSGSAKLTLALAYARYINCKQSLIEDSCGTCSSCLKYNTLSHPDLHLIFPVLKIKGERGSISDHYVNRWRELILKNPYSSLEKWIDLFRNKNKSGGSGVIYKDEASLIQKKLTLKTFEALYRVVLIWMPEKMNIQTSNKLLKTLEEPPNKTVFLLVSKNPSLLLPTILSRVQKTEVRNFTLQEIQIGLKNTNIAKEEINRLKHLTSSDFGEIIELSERKTQETMLFDNFSLWMRLVYKIDMLAVSKWTDSISTVGRKNQEQFLSYTIKMMRECLIFNFANKDLLKINKNEMEFVEKFSSFIHEENSVIIIEHIERAIKAINRNANAKILFFELSLQMMRFLKLKRKVVNK